MKDFITYEQAAKLNVLKPVGEEYEKKVKEIVRYFSKNTLAQMTNFDTFSQALDIMGYYDKKDYSQFLFDETEKLFNTVEELKIEIEKSTPKFVELAQTYTKAISETLKAEKIIKEKEIKKNCDSCGEEIKGEAKIMYDENFNVQEGLSQCEGCYKDYFKKDK